MSITNLLIIRIWPQNTSAYKQIFEFECIKSAESALALFKNRRNGEIFGASQGTAIMPNPP